MKLKYYLLVLLGLAVSNFGQSQTANFTASPTTICVGGSVQFTNTSVGAINNNWTFVDGGAGQTSASVNPSVTYSNPGVFDVILSVTNGGTGDTEVKAGFITVLAAATATLTSGAGTDNQSICINDPLIPITYDIAGATGATFSGLPVGVSGSFAPSPSGGTVTISGTPSSTGTFSYSFTTTGANCAPITVNGTITVGSPPTLSLTSGTSSPTVCVNTAISDITFTIGGSATGASVIGLPPGVTSSVSGGVLTITGTPTATGMYPYTVSTSGGACPPATFSGTINVDPDINLVSAPGTDNQTLCEDSNLVTILYSLGPSITGATVTGLPAGVVGSFIPGNFTISGTVSVPGLYNYTITTSGGPCGPATASGTITVQAGPALTLVTPGTDFQTLCETDPIVDIEYVVGGTATGAFATGLPAGVTGTFNLGLFTISGTSTALGSFPYSVTTTGSPCGDTTATGTINIDEVHQIQLASALASDTQQMCLNTTMDSLIYTFSGGATGATVIGLPSGLGFVISNDSIIITGAPDLPGSFPYTIHTTGGTCPADSAYAMMNIEDSTGVSLVSAVGTDMQIICEDEFIDSIIYVLSPGADTAIVTNLGPDFTSVFVNDSIIITGTSNTIGMVNYTIVGYGIFCPNDTVTGSIEVQSSALILSSPAGSNDQTVGVNQAIEPISYIVGGPVVVTDLPPGVTSTFVAGMPSVLNISGTPTQAGSFYYTVQFDGPCGNSILVGDITVTDDSVVTIPFDSTEIFIPNLFTPNGDGHNDFFVIPSLSLYPDTKIQIINREGVLVYINFDYDNTWDGTFDGEPLPEATYYYVLFVNEVEREFKGPITILRNEK